MRRLCDEYRRSLAVQRNPTDLPRGLDDARKLMSSAVLVLYSECMILLCMDYHVVSGALNFKEGKGKAAAAPPLETHIRMMKTKRKSLCNANGIAKMTHAIPINGIAKKSVVIQINGIAKKSDFTQIKGIAKKKGRERK